MKGIRFACLLLCIFLAGSNKGFCGDTLVELHSFWRYLDNGSTPPSNWATLSFVDTAWTVGQAELGYGDGDETTVVSFGSNPGNKYITTYFRHEFFVNSITNYKSLLLYLKRDDGAVIYINGVEVYRSNMPSGVITNSTLSQTAAGGSEESYIFAAGINLSTIHNGYNLISVELHQSATNQSDATFDLGLVADNDAQLMRGPYLQGATPNSMKVCWRTSSPDISKVLYGTSLTFSDTLKDTASVINHFANLTGLQPSTKYYYAICSSADVLFSDSETFFITPPLTITNEHTRIWAMGDFGNGSIMQNMTRDAFYTYEDTTYTNIFLMLGDNAYAVGSDENYTSQIFKGHYEDVLKQTVVYSTCGNHELLSATASNQTGPYYDIFSFPVNGEGGGLPSGTEAYYSFNYGNIHFVCLESNVDSFGATNLANMLTWLDSDLAANNQKWTIAYFHFPPLSKGYHDSDNNLTEIWCREHINPVLESHNVDLVLGGHSHDYERSHLLKGHYGISTTLVPSMLVDSNGGAPPNYYNKSVGQDSGTVYVVNGSSSEVTPIQSDWPHPAMATSYSNVYGSLVLDVSKDTLDVKFITNLDSIADHFVFVKDSQTVPVQNEIRRGPYLQTAAPVEMTIRWTTANPEITRVLYGTSLAYSDSLRDTTHVIDHTVRLFGLLPNTKYYYAIRTQNDSLTGDSSYYFYTAPAVGSNLPSRIWVMGDFGTGNATQANVRDAYYNYTGSIYTNLMLWLGNNAYTSGSLADYDLNVFSRFNSILKNSCVYSTCGNKELLSANALTGTGDYFDLFNFPKQGQSGGLPSGSESYYSFNYSNIHFVCLQSNIDLFGSTNSNAMINWLNADLTANTEKWTIIFFHYPPYTKGSGDSDFEANMISCRTILIPILEVHNVDLVLSSHSHSYERSVLMKGHFGGAATFNPSVMAIDTSSGTPPDFYDKTSSTVHGTVYSVLGSIADGLPVQTGWPHPAMYTAIDTTSGSLVIDVTSDTLDVKYLTSTNSILDHYAILKRTSTEVQKTTLVKTGKLLLYPDPVNSILTVQFTGVIDEKITLTIVNSMGQHVKSKVINGKFYFENIDLTALSKGVYFIKLQGRKTNITQRFVKE